MSKRDYRPDPMTPEELAEQQTLLKVAAAKNIRTTQLDKIKQSKTPNSEVGFFKPTAILAKRPTTTPLDAFIPDAIPNTVFLDKKSDFSPIDASGKKYVRTRNEPLNPKSPILIAHTSYLDNLYKKLKGDGPLGIKGPSNSTGPVSFGVFKQPYVVRNIGNDWGIDKFTSFSGTGLGIATDILRIGFNFLDELGGAVLGRQPSIYISRAYADLSRMGMFLASTKGIGFLAKQRVLKRKNPQKSLGSVRGPISGKYENATGNLIDLGQNLKEYNIGSLASQPGVAGVDEKGTGSLHFSINKFDAALSVQNSFPNVDLKIPEGILKKFPLNIKLQKKYNITIDSKLDFPTDKLLSLVAPVADLVSHLAGQGLRYLQSLKGPKINLKIGNPLKNLEFPKVKNPFSGMASLSPTNTFDFSKLDNTVQSAKAIIKGIQDIIPDINIDKLPVDSSKKEAVEQNLEAFAEVGVDRVNLIPYGDRGTATYNGENEEALDFIPFRFVDYNGKHIVFRAILSGISDSFTPDYAEEKYVGRPDKVYVYTGTTRTISFTFDVYPKSAEELPILWTKLNYLAGLTYPEMKSGFMVAPFSKLTIGDMFHELPGYISALTYTVQDNGTWETMFAKIPKYIQANVTYIYVGDRLPAMDQALYDFPWLQKKKNYDINKNIAKYEYFEEGMADKAIKRFRQDIVDTTKLDKFQVTKLLNMG